MNPEIPGPLRALQVARLWTAGDPGWTEALWAMHEQLGGTGAAARPDLATLTRATWVPVAIAGRVSHIRVDPAHHGSEFRHAPREGEPVAASEPLQLRSAPPLRLRGRLEAALAEWPEIIDTDPPLRPRLLRLQRDGVLPLGESLAGVLAEAASVSSDAIARVRLEQWLERTLRDYRGFELAGHEVGAGVLCVKALTSAMESTPAGSALASTQRARLLQRVLTDARSRPAVDIAVLACTELSRAGAIPTLVALADALVPPCVSAFEQAKQVGLEDPSVDPDTLMRRVTVEPHLMLNLWDRLHEALHLLAPQLQAGSLLLRVLLERPDGEGAALSAGTMLRLQRALSRVDELAVVVLNSLLQAVSMQDPLRRAQHVERIRHERERAGEPGARQVLRTLIEQQALFPRALRLALNEASRGMI